MNNEAAQLLLDILGPVLVLLTMFFYYRKIYYHFKFIGLHHPRLKDKSITILLFEPMIILEHLYILIPIFIKSGLKKEGKEKELETRISNSTMTFWILFGLTLLLLTTIARLTL